jgi:hypothetical protein
VDNLNKIFALGKGMNAAGKMKDEVLRCNETTHQREQYTLFNWQIGGVVLWAS